MVCDHFCWRAGARTTTVSSGHTTQRKTSPPNPKTEKQNPVATMRHTLLIDSSMHTLPKPLTRCMRADHVFAMGLQQKMKDIQPVR